MREDWDYVSFANYEKDMDDLAATSMAVADHYKRQIKAREAVIWAMVKAAGGKISLSNHDFHELPKNWEIHDDPANNTRVFVIKPSHTTEAIE